MKRTIGRELDSRQLRTVAGGGWFSNNWFFGYSFACQSGADNAYNVAFELNQMDQRDQGLDFDYDSARGAGWAAADDFMANDPSCQ